MELINLTDILLGEDEPTISSIVKKRMDESYIELDTVADLKAMIETPKRVHISGYHTKGDRAYGSNFFALRYGVIPDGTYGNTGTTYESVNGVYDLVFKGAIKPEFFGVMGDGVNDDTIYLKNMFTFVNKDDNFIDTIKFPTFSGHRGVGAVPTIELNGEDVYAISDTLIISSNVNIKGNGATFIALPGCANKHMIHLKYNFDGNGVEAYALSFNSISNINIDGKGFACTGLLLEKTNWSSFSDINVCGITTDTDGYYGYGIKLEEVQYTIFTNVHSGANYNGWHLGNSPDLPNLRCVDVTFVGCSSNSNVRLGIHISNASKCSAVKFDVSRNGGGSYQGTDGYDILFDSDNGDGTVSNTVSRLNTFLQTSIEVNEFDKPTGGSLIKFTGSAYSNVFDNMTVEFQPYEGVECTVRVVESSLGSSSGNTFNNLILGQQNNILLPRNPSDTSKPFPLFMSGRYGGLNINFGVWSPNINDIGYLSTDTSGNILHKTDERVCITVTGGSYSYNSSTRQIKAIQNVGTDGFQTIVKDNQNPSVHLDDGVSFGDGLKSIADMPKLKHYNNAYGIQAKKSFKVGDNNYSSENKFWLGSYQIWVDANGNIRYKKFGSTGDTSGTLLGSVLGVTDSFTADGKTITVTDGIITNIA